MKIVLSLFMILFTSFSLRGRGPALPERSLLQKISFRKLGMGDDARTWAQIGTGAVPGALAGYLFKGPYFEETKILDTYNKSRELVNQRVSDRERDFKKTLKELEEKVHDRKKKFRDLEQKMETLIIGLRAKAESMVRQDIENAKKKSI